LINICIEIATVFFLIVLFSKIPATVNHLVRFKAMFTPELIATVFYGLLSIVGGIMGYIKSQSKVSLIYGGVSPKGRRGANALA
jgi:hypothetical protein